MSKNDVNWDKYYETLIKESDRGSVIVGASMLEHLLEKLIRKKLFAATKGSRKESTKSLFERNGPFSSFWSNINFTYALGIIDEDIYNSLELIRKIRNEFAHNYDMVSFDDTKISNKMKKLIILENKLSLLNQNGPENNNDKTNNSENTEIEDKNKDDRHIFVLTVSFIGGYLDTMIEKLNILAPGILSAQNEDN